MNGFIWPAPHHFFSTSSIITTLIHQQRWAPLSDHHPTTTVSRKSRPARNPSNKGCVWYRNGCARNDDGRIDEGWCLINRIHIDDIWLGFIHVQLVSAVFLGGLTQWQSTTIWGSQSNNIQRNAAPQPKQVVFGIHWVCLGVGHLILTHSRGSTRNGGAENLSNVNHWVRECERFFFIRRSGNKKNSTGSPLKCWVPPFLMDKTHPFQTNHLGVNEATCLNHAVPLLLHPEIAGKIYGSKLDIGGLGGAEW